MRYSDNVALSQGGVWVGDEVGPVFEEVLAGISTWAWISDGGD